MDEKNSIEERADKVADAVGDVGEGLKGCGCLLTIFVTIPAIIFIFFIL